MSSQPVAVSPPGLSTRSPVSLRALSRRDAETMLAGSRPAGDPRWHPQYPTEDTVGAVRLLLEAQPDPGPRPRWWIHQIVVDGLVVGDIGFHGPPAADSPRMVEIGYQVVPDWRGRGVATRACALLVELGWRDGTEEIWADADPANVASRTVLTRNGFGVGPDGRFRLVRPVP